MFGSQRTKLALVIITAAIICVGAAVPAQSLMLVSRSDEVKIGEQVEQSVIKEYGGLSRDQALVGRVQRVGKKAVSYTHLTLPTTPYV